MNTALVEDGSDDVLVEDGTGLSNKAVDKQRRGDHLALTVIEDERRSFKEPRWWSPLSNGN